MRNIAHPHRPGRCIVRAGFCLYSTANQGPPNNTARLPDTLAKLQNLSPLSGLAPLQQLYCSCTPVSDLAPFLWRIEGGFLVKWESFFNYADKDSAILVQNCPLIIHPVEFAMESPQAVRDYFEELGEDGRKRNEVKVVFPGEWITSAVNRDEARAKLSESLRPALDSAQQRKAMEEWLRRGGPDR